MPTPIAVSTIVAQTFRFMEAGPISSFDDDTEQAIAAAEQYLTALHSCLEACDWAFASTLAYLPELVPLPGSVTATDPDLPYLYALPADLLIIREVGTDWTAWRRDREGLRADDAAPLRIRYTAAVTAEASLPATFRTAVSLRLATLLAPRWLTTQSKIQYLQIQFEDALKAAMRHDGRNASSARYDGQQDQGDWASEAVR